MTCESLCEIIERTGKVKIRDLSQVVTETFQYAAQEENAAEYLVPLQKVMETVDSQSVFEGSPDDFHNLSVAFARQEEYLYAYQILQKGLERFPYAVDLLADSLNYGMQCNHYEDCIKNYETLLRVRKRWNWRAYQFSIEFLKKRMDMTPDVDIDELKQLVQDFIHAQPEHEEGYLEKAKLIRDYGSDDETQHETYASVLEYALSDECPVGRTPKCALSLADYYYDNADLSGALRIIDICKKDSVEIQFSVNRNYVYLLSALCRMSMYYDSVHSESKKAEKGSEQEKQVLMVYEDYHVAAVDPHDSRVQGCRKTIEAFVRETGVSYPYDDDIENG